MIVPCQGYAVSKRSSSGIVMTGAKVVGLTVAVELDARVVTALLCWDPEKSTLCWIDWDDTLAIGMAQIGGQSRQIAVPGR